MERHLAGIAAWRLEVGSHPVVDRETALGLPAVDMVIADLERHKAVLAQEAGSGRHVPSCGMRSGRAWRE